MSGRILIVDDVATNRFVMKVKLAAARYDVVQAASGAEALEIARQGNVDLIIMDMRMPGLTGAEATHQLRSDAATADLPVILVTASDETKARMEGLSAGADDFLTTPVDEIALLARVRSLLRVREEEREYESRAEGLIALSEPTAPVRGFAESGQAAFQAARMEGRIALLQGPEATWLCGQMDDLRKLFREEFAFLSRDGALALSRADAPDLFLIDADCCGHNEGLRLMSELRSRSATRHAAIVIVLPAGETERAANALDMGAADVVYRPVACDEIAMRLRTQLARKRRADQMRDTLDSGLRMAVTDPLTGLHNRRYGLHHLDRVAARCRAQGLRAGIILMDVDHFKRVNDTHGHPVGDRVLSKVAQVLKESLRGEDLVARIGGEEFLAILPDAGLEQVRAVAERLREAIAALRVPLDGGAELGVTLSLGVAMLEDRPDAAPHALACVDRALYAAKDGGRNRLTLATDAA
ncbi:MAG: diguanylate cyclase [Pseudomonadota bacterium]